MRNWETVRQSGYFRDAIALCSRTTPPAYLAYLESHHIGAIITGGTHVDLRDAIRQLASRYHARRIRVDAGGMLNGLLLREGLVDEINLLVHPCLIGGTSPRSFFRAPDFISPEGVIPLSLVSAERLGEDLVNLLYRVIHEKWIC